MPADQAPDWQAQKRLREEIRALYEEAQQTVGWRAYEEEMQRLGAGQGVKSAARPLPGGSPAAAWSKPGPVNPHIEGQH